MGQSTALVKALKQQLKARGKTYADVADVLDLSEASVKRLFAEGNFTLQRLEAVLHMIGLELTELVDEMQRKRSQLECLTAEQEAKIASDVELLLVAVSVINGFSFDDLKQYYAIGDHVLIQKLATLDRLRMIELLPGNRIKLRIAPHFRWLANGPIQKFFLAHVASDYFNSRFDRDEEKLLVINLLCTAATNKEIQLRMDSFINDIGELAKKDRSLSIPQKHGNTMVLAIRQWQYSLFSEYLRVNEEHVESQP